MHDEGVVNGMLLIPDMLSQCLYSHECFSSRVEPPVFWGDAGFGFFFSVFLGPVRAGRELCHDYVVDAFTV